MAPSTTQRLVYALVLVPIIPAFTLIAAILSDELYPGSWLGDDRGSRFLASTLAVTATIIIWRSAVIWTLGRRWLTALIALVPFVQVVYAKPLWSNPGCTHDMVMGIGQYQLTIGLWIWLSIWVWWGWEKLAMKHDELCAARLKSSVSPIATRVATSIGLLPILLAAGILVSEAFDNFLAWSEPAPAMAVTSVITVVAWWLIWRKCVVWTWSVKQRTLKWTIGLVGFPALVHLLIWDRTSYGAMLTASAILGWGIWMAITISIWPLKPEAVARGDVTPRCLKCGYLLTGLRATRCPECGDEPTIDELWAATTTGW